MADETTTKAATADDLDARLAEIEAMLAQASTTSAGVTFPNIPVMASIAEKAPWLISIIRAERAARAAAEGENAILKHWVGLLAADLGHKDPSVFIALENGVGPLVGVFAIVGTTSHPSVEPLEVRVPKQAAAGNAGDAKEAL